MGVNKQFKFFDYFQIFKKVGSAKRNASIWVTVMNCLRVSVVIQPEGPGIQEYVQLLRWVYRTLKSLRTEC